MKVERPTQKELERMYYEEGILLKEIADKYSVRVPSVIKWMKKHNIARRNKTDSNLRRWNKKHPSKEELERLYSQEGISSVSLAERYKVRPITICSWLRKSRIKIRNNSEAQLRFTRPSGEELYRSYSEQKLTTTDLAEKYGVGKSTIIRWMERDGNKIKGPLVKPRQWCDLEFALSQAKKFLEENPEYVELPGMRTLTKRGYLVLGSNINKYHGGLPNFRQRLNECLGRQSEEIGSSLLEVYVGGNGND